MIGWIIDAIPWWGWLLIVATIAGPPIYIFWPIVLGVWERLPASARIALIGLGGALIAYLSGRNQGRNNEIERQKQRDLRAEQTRKAVDASVDAKTEKQKDEDWKRWQRD